MIVGYAKAGNQEHNIAWQVKKLLEFGVLEENIYRDKGKASESELEDYLESLKEDDVLVIAELTRISSGIRNLVGIVERVRNNGLHLVSLKENLDTRNAAGQSLFFASNLLTRFEKDVASESTKNGMIKAKSKGKKLGRPSANKENIENAMILYNMKKLSIKDVCLMSGISRPTLYKYLSQEAKLTNKQD